MKPHDKVLVDLPMPIRTPRLLLRPGRAGDGPHLLDAKRESWPELGQWLSWANGPVDALAADEEEASVRRRAAEFILRDEVWLPAFSPGEDRLLAVGGYHAIDWTGRLFSISYWVRTGETGKGIAAELLNALVRYAFGALAANRVAISYADGNERSRRVIEKAGFVWEGTTRKFYVLNDTLVDSHHYARFDCSGLPALEVSWGSATPGIDRS